MSELRLGFAAFCAAIACAQPGAAQAADDYFLQISPFVSYRAGGSFEDEETGDDIDIDNSSAYGLVINFPAERHTEYEIYFSKQSTELKTGDLFQQQGIVDLDIYQLQIGGTYLFETRGKSQPYFAATIGGARYDPDGPGLSSDEFFSFTVGGGWKYFPTRNVGLRLDSRFLGTIIDSDSEIFCTSGREGSGCIINNKGEMLWQFELQAGVVVRF